jgi:hypothetical protein
MDCGQPSTPIADYAGQGSSMFSDLLIDASNGPTNDCTFDNGAQETSGNEAQILRTSFINQIIDEPVTAIGEVRS